MVFSHLDQQLFLLRNRLCRMQSPADCAELVGVCERTSHPSFLVLRKCGHQFETSEYLRPHSSSVT